MRLSAAELRQRAREARDQYRHCDLCAHHCGVDRTRGPAGVCREGDGVFLAGAGVHFGEEPALVPSGLILIAGCNLACSYCETFGFSLERRGAFAVSAEQLAALLLDLQRRGARNANFVTPTHVMPALLEGLAIAKERGLALPVVWNCGGYESLAALRLLDGVVDLYLPDAKYGDDALAFELSGCRGYAGALREGLREMKRQAEVLVRHLVLPGAGARKVMELIASVSTSLTVNVLSQYRPAHRARSLAILARRASDEEIRAAVDQALASGLTRVLLDGRPVSGSIGARAEERPPAR